MWGLVFTVAADRIRCARYRGNWCTRCFSPTLGRAVPCPPRFASPFVAIFFCHSQWNIRQYGIFCRMSRCPGTDWHGNLRERNGVFCHFSCVLSAVWRRWRLIFCIFAGRMAEIGYTSAELPVRTWNSCLRFSRFLPICFPTEALHIGKWRWYHITMGRLERKHTVV